MAAKKTLPKFLTESERLALLKVPNKRYLTGHRNLVMLHLMASVGLRVGEVLNLKLADVDLNTGKLMVREGKGKKDRAVYLNGETLELLRSWRERKPESELYFTTLKGEPINDRYLRAAVERMGKKAGIEKHVHPHMLRHTFATQFFGETKNILMTQKALGHSDVSTTMIYTHVVDAEMESAMKGFRGK